MTNIFIRCSSPGLFAEGVKNKTGVLPRATTIVFAKSIIIPAKKIRHYQLKTLSTVVVLLRTEAKNFLIDKYNMHMPQVSNPNFNYCIKEVVRLGGIDQRIIRFVSIKIFRIR